MKPHRAASSIFDQIKDAITSAENTERELSTQRFRAAQQETVLKIMARRNNGRLQWTASELDAATEDDRCVMLGALDMDLYGERHSADAPTLINENHE
jgi:hypothetical protein